MQKVCEKCNNEVYMTHTKQQCEYNQFSQDVNAKKMMFVSNSEYLEELKNSKHGEVTTFKWKIGNAKSDGYIEISYVPSHVGNVMINHASGDGFGMTLTELLEGYFG